MAGEISVLDEIITSITDCHSFVLQGGAGCGKTETLKQLIDFISDEQPDKKIACITHTNKAVDEIKSRIKDGHVVSTIHSFLNSLIKDYKRNIQKIIIELFKIDLIERESLDKYADEKEQKSKEHEKYKKTYNKFAGGYFTVFGVRIDKVEGKKDYDTRPDELNQILNEKIEDLHKEMLKIIEEKGFKSIKYNETRFNDFKDLTFGHDGLLEVAALLFDRNPLLGKIISDKFDYIFIDEYQDTNNKIISLFLDKLPEKNKVVIGLFGDSMQSIYGDGIGNVNVYIQAGKLRRIEKKDNFRCSPQVINFINTLRNDGLVQKLALKNINGIEEVEKDRAGSVEFFYAIYKDKPNVKSPEDKIKYIELVNALIDQSTFEGESKILLLSNKAISVKAGFPELHNVFSARYTDPKEEILKVLTRLQLLDLFEICNSYKDKNYNFILSKLKRSGLSLQKGSDKKDICDAIQTVIDSKRGAVATVEMAFELKLLKKSESFTEYTNRADSFLKEIALDADYITFESDYYADGHTLSKMQKKVPEIDEDTFKEQERNVKKKQFYQSLLSEDISFKEVMNYFTYENDQTPYITMHKTKGTGIDNVLVVMEEYFWNEYDFFSTFDPSEKDIAKVDKNKQLIYVACSRAKLNLRCVRLVSDQELSTFIEAFKGWDTKELNL